MASEAQKLIAALNAVARDADALARESSALSHELGGLANVPPAFKGGGALQASGNAAAAAH
ncbi:hypothetical protein [Brevibacterium otitidis]|uniref:Methyl-accepting chemotaxis protein n=1 Tax=Brevibacterium otitidis TaxID=53364 RepID=A0ABV5X5E9_9MICO